MIPDASLIESALTGLAAVAMLAIIVWSISVAKHDVGIVDVVWPIFICLPAVVVVLLEPPGPRAVAVLALALAWAARLSGHIALRSLGEPEDRRYQAIRRRNEPGFVIKSLYLVFLLQAALGWIVATPLMTAVAGHAPWSFIDTVGIALMAFGIAFEAIADWQLRAFKRDPSSEGQVMDKGLWRYSRHPNYFGEFCIWWGAWLLATATGAWWTIVSPLLMSVLLLRVSGVALLEEDIGKRRPGYDDYVRRTNAFFPGRPGP
ncbi:MAG: DUF1295 domain-containing protein [Burkholderiaceae bacterium]